MDIKWKNASSGVWSTAGNWTPAVTPGSGDNATIDVAGSYIVEVASGTTVGNLLLNDAGATTFLDGAFSVNGTLTIAAGKVQVPNSGDLFVGALSNQGTIDILAGGTLGINSDVTPAELGTIHDKGAVNIGGTLDLGGGTFTALSGFAAFIANGTLAGMTNVGTIGGVLQGAGTIDAVTLQGGVTVDHPAFSLHIRNGLAIIGADGSGAGTLIDRTSVYFLNDQTFSIGTILTDGFSGVINMFGTTTVGSAAVVGVPAGSSGFIGVVHQFPTDDNGTLLNQGMVFSDGRLEIDAKFINAGSLIAGATGSVDVKSSQFTNTPTGIIAGGTFHFGGGSFTNDGSIDGDTITIDSNISGSGTIGFTTSFTVAGLSGLGQTYDLQGDAVLNIAQPSLFLSTIADIDQADTIVVPGVVSGSSYSNDTLHLDFVGGGAADLHFGGLPPTPTFAFSPVGTVATDITLSLPCFAAGTRITTPHGDVPVEALQPGDTVISHLTARAEPIVWIGHRRVDLLRHPNPSSLQPVRIAAGAFSPVAPASDLLLSPDHAVFHDGVLIPVKYLINGTSIVQLDVASITYFHVELAKHDVLLAENLPVESYLDAGDRTGFANSGGVVALHPDFNTRQWEANGCAPLVVAGEKLAALRAYLGLCARVNLCRVAAAS